MTRRLQQIGKQTEIPHFPALLVTYPSDSNLMDPRDRRPTEIERINDADQNSPSTEPPIDAKEPDFPPRNTFIAKVKDFFQGVILPPLFKKTGVTP